MIYSHLSDVGAGNEKGSGVAFSFAFDGGFMLRTSDEKWRLGLSVQNIGPNVVYVDAAQADPLPRNLKLGFAYMPVDDAYNRLTLAYDADKELVGVKDHLHTELFEIKHHFGVEYVYSNLLSLRAGWYQDDEGQISTPMFGAGILLKDINVDLSYIPNSEKVTISGTTRISIGYRF